MKGGGADVELDEAHYASPDCQLKVGGATHPTVSEVSSGTKMSPCHETIVL